MTTRFTDRSQARHEARPGRRAVVAPNLSELHGPTSGVVELPHRLFWQPSRSVDLDDPALLRWTYETVLREAVSVAELRAWLDGETLIRLWPELFVPKGVRAAWQHKHPVLRRRAHDQADISPLRPSQPSGHHGDRPCPPS